MCLLFAESHEVVQTDLAKKEKEKILNENGGFLVVLRC
jgi:hypothetical protein